MSFIYKNFNNLCAIVVSNFQNESQSDSSQYELSLQSDSSQSISSSQSENFLRNGIFSQRETSTQSEIAVQSETSTQSETSEKIAQMEVSPPIKQCKTLQVEKPVQVERSLQKDENINSEKISDNRLFDILNQKLLKDEIFSNYHNDSKLAKLIDILEETSQNILAVQKKIDSIRPRYSVNRKLYQHLWKRRIVLENHYLLIKKAYLDRFFKLEIGKLEGPSIYLSASAD
jgi:hypothetical protein